MSRPYAEGSVLTRMWCNFFLFRSMLALGREFHVQREKWDTDLWFSHFAFFSVFSRSAFWRLNRSKPGQRPVPTFSLLTSPHFKAEFGRRRARSSCSAELYKGTRITAKSMMVTRFLFHLARGKRTAGLKGTHRSLNVRRAILINIKNIFPGKQKQTI